MPQKQPYQPAHLSLHEQDLAVAIVTWLMLAGIMVVIANVWAMEVLI